MAAPTNYFVDPSLGSDTGDGSLSTPWGRAAGEVVQYAIATGITQDAANGDQINVKNGTDDTLGASLDLTAYGTPTYTAPLVIRGYTSAANDGGQGGIDGDATYSIINDANLDYIYFHDMHLHNTGANTIALLDNSCSFINCEINNCTENGIDVDNSCTILGCYVYNIGKTSIAVLSDSVIENNYVLDDTNAMWYGIFLGYARNCAVGNIVTVKDNSSASGIYFTNYGNLVSYNSVLCSGGTGRGIYNAGSREQNVIHSNLIEGFSGAGGDGIDLGTIIYPTYMMNNGVFNCTSKYTTGSAETLAIDENNDELTASPFLKTGSNTFANRFAYFEPSDAGNIRGGAYPSGCRRDKGAVQHIHRKRRLQMRVIA